MYSSDFFDSPNHRSGVVVTGYGHKPVTFQRNNGTWAADAHPSYTQAAGDRRKV